LALSLRKQFAGLLPPRPAQPDDAEPEDATHA
jgi:hypothetical protein